MLIKDRWKICKHKKRKKKKSKIALYEQPQLVFWYASFSYIYTLKLFFVFIL